MNSPLPYYYCLIRILLLLHDLNLPHLIPSLSLIAASLSLVSAFNIDEEFPIVITNKFNGQNAHFGASVLLLPNSSTEHETDVTGWVLIGAPKANCTFHANHSSIYEPGIIWRCALGPIRPSRSKICEVVEMDPMGEYDPFDRKLPFTDRKDGGWLGGSMFVGDSDRFVTCASRWTNKKYNALYLVNGICYWLPKSNLMKENTSDPAWPRVAPDLSNRLSPLLNGTKQTYITIVNNSVSHQVDKTVTYDWAFGQFGFSLHLTQKNELVVGSVGILDWTGSLVYYRDTLNPRSRFHRYNAQADSPAFSEVVVVRPQYHTDLIQTADYFGYSITSGKFFHQNITGNKTQFAAGAPRSSHLSGKVLVFTVKELEKGKSEGMLELIVEPIEGSETKKGNHYGSYFGQILLALDGNRDGFDDLFVGAPLYGAAVRIKRNAETKESPSEEETEDEEGEEEKTAKMKSGDEGCVFVYWSTGADFNRDPQVLCGDKMAGARFGTAITSLKDINYDRFNDVAIGAPYENEGRGAVYIYHGGKHMSLAQKLQPKSIDPKIRTFGWSLSLGVDIDDNGYPDLAVGAYETNQVVIYRTIPIVHFEVTLTASISKLLSTTGEFNLTSCLSYNGHGKMPPDLDIWIKLTIQVEPEGKRLVSLVHGSPERSAAKLVTSLKELMKFQYDELSCYNFTAVRNGSVDGITKKVPILMEYWLEEHGASHGSVTPVHYVIEKSESDLHLSPFINLNSSKSSFANFSHKLPLPVGNTFGTKELNLTVGTICEADGDPECLANLTISANLADYKTHKIFDPLNPFILGTAQILTLAVELFNHRETANLPVKLFIRLPYPPSVRRFPNCDHLSGGNYSCSVRRPLKEMQKETFIIELDMSNVYGGPFDKNLDIQLEATTSSLLVQECNHQISVPMRTQLQPQNFGHMDSKIEYAPGNDSIPTFGISQAFEIGLMGPSTAAAIRVDFDIPRKVGINGKMLELIGLKRPIVAYDGEATCYPVNGSYLHEGQSEPPTFSTLVPPVKVLQAHPDQHESYDNNDDPSFSIDTFSERQNEEDDTFLVNEVSKILLGKTRRGKRSIKKTTNQLEETGEILRISCGSPQKRLIDCLRISCIFSHFTPQKKAVVELKLKMYNKVASLLLNSESEFRIEDISSVRIVSVGSVRAVDSRGKPFGPEGKVEFISRLEIPPPYELPAWILIVSVAGGLLSLLFIMLVLKKCGFFKRHKREELMHDRKLMELRMQANLSINNPGTSSTARIRTSSSRRSHNSSVKQKHSFSRAGDSTNSVKKKHSNISGQGALMSLATSSHHSLSPATLAKQRDGAVDLNELRRLYANEDQNDNDPYF